MSDGALEVLGTARDYEALHRLIRRHVETLGVTRSSIDEASGLPDRYTAKLLAPVPMRSLGRTSMGAVLQSLGLVLLVAIDRGDMERVTGKLLKRERPSTAPPETGIAA